MYSLCTTLSLEWEPDLIAISVLYLSCRLMKFKVTSWMDKPNDYTGKWYTFFVNDVSLDIIDSKFLSRDLQFSLLFTDLPVCSA